MVVLRVQLQQWDLARSVRITGSPHFNIFRYFHQIFHVINKKKILSGLYSNSLYFLDILLRCTRLRTQCSKTYFTISSAKLSTDRTSLSYFLVLDFNVLFLFILKTIKKRKYAWLCLWLLEFTYSASIL